MAEKRVIEQTASSEIYNDDWFLKDSVLEGTSKISKVNLINEIGASKINAIAEDYDSTSTYNKDDFAFYENKLYRCLANNTTGTWDAEKWEEFDLPTALITTAHNIETAEFTIGTYYSADDLVLKDGKLYQCVVGHNATEWKSQFWRAVTIDEMLGYLSSSLAPEHNPSTVYAVGDLVTHNKALWRCTQAGAGSFVNANWEEVTVSALIAEISDNLTADGISYDNTTSGLEADDVQEAIDEVVTDIESVETALETKADVDGFYEELYAGNLLSDNTETDNAPYLYRPSPSGKSYVDLSVVGGTVAWNQLADQSSALTKTWSAEGAYYGTLGSLDKSITTYENHVYFCGMYLTRQISDNNAVGINLLSSSSNLLINYDNGEANGYKSIIVKCNGNYNSSNVRYSNYSGKQGFSIGDSLSVDKIQLIDLTQAFGSTIADYIYSLEQAEAGSGIAWLKSYGFLTKNYYAYQSGKLESVNVASRKVVGFNQWDEEWITGYYRNGIFVYGTDSICCKNKIRVMPNTTYYLYKASSANFFYTFYDANGLFLSLSGYDSQGRYQMVSSGAISVPNDAYYMTFNMGSAYGSTYNNDICINISDASKNGTYEPYIKHTYPLDSSLTLRGILKKDANNNLYYDGDTYESDGSVTRRYGVVDLGTLNWTYSNNNGAWPNYLFFANLSTLKNNSKEVKCINYVTFDGNISTSLFGDKCIGTSSNYIYVHDSSYTDAPTFKSAMSGVYLVYELATPTSETADSYENPQLVGSTEEFVDAGTSASTPTRDVAIPAGQDSKYHTDLKAKLEELAKIPDVPSTNGTYTLKATRSASGVAYNWISG